MEGLGIIKEVEEIEGIGEIGEVIIMEKEIHNDSKKKKNNK